MRREIRNVKNVRFKESTVIMDGEGGALWLRALSDSAFLIEYHIDKSVPVSDERQETAYPTIWPGLNNEYTTVFDSIDESDTTIRAYKGPTVIEIEKKTTTVTVFQQGVRVFGGPLGHSETVVPAYPLRVQDSLTRETETERPGKFNFNLEPDDIFVGLGEKSGGIIKNKRRFKMYNRDALGYDASVSDPLYCAVPFFMQLNKKYSTVAGIFFPTTRVDEIDFGVESNYYTAVSLSDGPYAYVVFVGDTYRDILRSYYTVTGFPVLPPRIHFGFFGSSMSYIEPDDAEQRVLDFFSKTETEGIPCEGIYFSSGYVKTKNGKRFTFLWNKEKFPDPAHFIGSLRARGYHVVCNIKSGILKDHPWYRSLAEQGFFIPAENGQPLEEYYWGGNASLIDFTNEKGRAWWQDQLHRYFIDYGVEGIWNDNNEFELEDESSPRFHDRKLMPLYMAETSYQALIQAHPGKRPWIISRAGYAGLQRFASIWTGDNVSDEVSMKWNIPMGMNMGLSGLPFYGHDIGGFYGPVPGPDLLLRWCQSAVFQPRFIIHSWNPDGMPTEPWMYPEISRTLASLIRLRYFFMPYLYSTAFSAALHGIPIERPAWLEAFPATVYDYGSLEHFVGDDLFVVPPQAVGPHEVSWIFPLGSSWVSSDFRSRFTGVSRANQRYPESVPLYFYRSGSALPVRQTRDRIHEGFYDELVLLVVPLSPGEGPTESVIYEDDGSHIVEPGSYCAYTVGQDHDGAMVHCTITVIAFSEFVAVPRPVRLMLPEGYGFVSHRDGEQPVPQVSHTFSSVGDTAEVMIAERI